MSRVVPSHDEGHLIVAGIRVMAHREGRPPLLDDVAAEIGMPADLVRVLVLEMEKLGILRQLTAAFETRLAVDDHQPDVLRRQEQLEPVEEGDPVLGHPALDDDDAPVHGRASTPAGRRSIAAR